MMYSSLRRSYESFMGDGSCYDCRDAARTGPLLSSLTGPASPAEPPVLRAESVQVSPHDPRILIPVCQGHRSMRERLGWAELPLEEGVLLMTAELVLGS